MGKKLYVGNLPFSFDDQTLSDKFSESGQVESAKVITDRDSGRSRGFGFVEMSTDEEAKNAISKFDGYECEGRALKVNESRPMEKNRGGGGGGGGRGFGGKNRGGYGRD